jgi:hypothetical protein
MSTLLMICLECDSLEFVRFDGDGPSMCPSCRSVDCFREPTDEERESA